MNKLMTVVAASVCAVSFSGVAVAAETQVNENKEAAEAAEQEESSAFEAGFDFDFFSAYVWRNAIMTDEMVMQPSVWADWTFIDPFYIGGSFWQNYDLTNRRGEYLRKGLTETDYNVHVGATAWASDDGNQELGIEIGHEWYDNDFVRSGWGNDCPDTRELYALITYDNPIVNIYGRASWMYADFGDYSSGLHYEIGFNKEFDVAEFIDIPEDTLAIGADWNVNFADEDYTMFLYGTDTYGFGGTTIKFYLNWSVTSWMKLCGTIAYTGILNASSRDELDDADYDRDFVWGGFSLKLEF